MNRDLISYSNEFANKIFQRTKSRISAKRKITLISHIDADGISSMSIMVKTLQREKIKFKGLFLRQLDDLTIKKIPKDDSLKFFLDMGSGQQELLRNHRFDKEDILIIDHHVPRNITNQRFVSDELSKIEDFCMSKSEILSTSICNNYYDQFNSYVFNEHKISASGLCYLVSRSINDNYDLSKLAVVGAVGDMMANETNRLEGIMREILNDGIKEGIIEVTNDFSIYGISTRPIHTLLAYSNDPFIDGLSDNTTECLNFLEGLQIPIKDKDDWRVWEDLTNDEKTKIRSTISSMISTDNMNRLLGEEYIFKDEKKRTPLRNAKEFSTLLNACGRWVKPKIGMYVCLGDRGRYYEDALLMLKNHKKVIRDLYNHILGKGVVELDSIQYIDVKDYFPDTIIGIGAGMVLSKVNREKPIIIIGDILGEKDVRKISARSNSEQIKKGVNLQKAISRVTELFGGNGGGHNIAAGGYLPKGCEKEFLLNMDKYIKEQLNGR